MASRAQLERWADEAARAEGVDPRLFRALIQAESGWRVDARSPVGATGLTQLMPATGRSLGVTNPLDPRQNLRGGAKYIGQQLRAFKGDPRLALAAYNAGPGAVSRYGGIPPFRETQNYVAKIMGSLGSTPIASPQAPAAGGGGLPAAGGALIRGASLSGSPMELLSALRSLRAGDAPIRARGHSATSGITRLAGLQMLKSAMAPRPAPSAPGMPAASTEVQPPINLGDGTFAHPTGGRGTIIGRPGQGTHDFNKWPHNWQSDNAIDFGVPVGTPLFAPSAGVVGPNFGSLGPASSRFGGVRLTIQGQGGAPSWYMSHITRYAPGIRPGVRVARGQKIGYSGSGNNVPHLHIAVDRGDPQRLLGIR